MRVIGNFNKISKEMKEKLPELKRGETKTFQLVTGALNRDPDPQQRIERPMFYSTWQIPSRCFINDWHTGEAVEIGVVETYKKDEVLSTRLLMPGLGENQFKFIGKWSLNGDSQQDRDIYEYFCMCPYNLSNPQRDTTIEPIFCELNIVKDSKEALSKEDAMLEAMNAAKNIGKDEMEQIAAALVWPVYAEESVLRSKMRTFAKENPVEFNTLYKDPATKVKAEIKNALDKGIISYNAVDKTVKLGSSVVATLDIRQGSNHVESFYEHVQSAPNGEQSMTAIRKQLKVKDKEPTS